MNFRVLAEEELRNYAAKRETLERLQKQSAFLEQVAQNFYGRMVLLPDRREIEERIQRMRREVSMVERALRQLDRPEYIVLEKMFFRPEKHAAERLMNDLGYEKASIYRMKEEALIKFTRSLFGFVET